ncbi:MAG: Asp-tRNA(Asn)/Glu-tRNA(Gln) amidotransferase GatCAB subunit B, partial [Candidatus Bathyarchaeales archaeon]
AQHEDKTPQEAICSLGLKILSKEEIEEIADKIIKANKETIQKRGKEAFNLIVGLVMKEARGKARPEEVVEIIRKKLE